MMAGEEAGIVLPGVDAFHHSRLERPELYVVSVAHEQVRQCRAPRACAQHCASHQDVASFFTNRCSSPRRSRPILARWVQNTNAAMTTLAMNTAEWMSRRSR